MVDNFIDVMSNKLHETANNIQQTTNAFDENQLKHFMKVYYTFLLNIYQQLAIEEVI